MCNVCACCSCFWVIVRSDGTQVVVQCNSRGVDVRTPVLHMLVHVN